MTPPRWAVTSTADEIRKIANLMQEALDTIKENRR